MGAGDELRTLRGRVAEIRAEIDRIQGDRPDGQAAMVGKVYDKGSIPTTVPAMFAVHPVDIGGVEAEDEDVSVAESTGVVYFLVVGPSVPVAGDILIAESCGGRWVAEHQVAEPPSPGTPPSIGEWHHRVVGYVTPGDVSPFAEVGGGNFPPVVTLQDAQAGPINRRVQLKFGGAITGGTFTLTFGFAFSPQTTAAINWSPDNATLLANIDAALIALSNVAPGDLTLEAGTLSGGHGTINVHYGGAWSGTTGNSSPLVVASNGLTGMSPTIVIMSVRGGSTSLAETQYILYHYGYFDYKPTGGTFKLSLDGETTAAITWNGGSDIITSANVKSALEALPGVGSGGVASVSGDGFGLTVSFVGTTDRGPMTIVDNALNGDRLDVLSGATVDLYKDGVLMGTATTDSEGLVEIPLTEIGTGFTFDMTKSGYTTVTGTQPSNGLDALGTLRGGYNAPRSFRMPRP